MRGYRRKNARGRPVQFKTWLSVWMSMKKLSIPELAKIMVVGTASVERWRRGRPIRMHHAAWLRAFFPDAPVHGYGGPVARIDQPMPVNTRSKEMYAFIFQTIGLIDGHAHPEALARARGIGVKA